MSNRNMETQMIENKNDKIAKGLMADRLDEYLPTREDIGADDSVVPLSVRARVKGRGDYGVPVVPHKTPPLSRREWVQRNPALATPHVLSRPKADEKLRAIKARVRVGDGEAVFSQEDWDEAVSEVVAMMLDCAEGVGLVVKSGALGRALRQVVGQAMLEEMSFMCDSDSIMKVVVSK